MTQHTPTTAATDTSPHSPVHALTPEDALQLKQLRTLRRSHRHHRAASPAALPHPPVVLAPTRGQRLADGVAATIGSWRFIAIQSSAIVVWITGNVLVGSGAWDPYPFILLNLLLSFQAAYTAPAIMMSQNRQSELDRRHAEIDYEINVKAELEIELLHEKMDLMKERELLALTDAVRELSAQVKTLSARAQG